MVISFAYPVVKKVSTHSRLKAAGAYGDRDIMHPDVSTHSRLKAAGSQPLLQGGYG